MASALSARGVDVLSLENVPAGSPWPDLLREAWPGRRPHLAAVSAVGAPCVDLPAGGPEEWFAGRSGTSASRSAGAGASSRGAVDAWRWPRTSDEVRAGLREFVRLHHGRWADRGGSQALHGSMPLMLQRAAEELGPDRLQVWTATADGGTVAAALFVAAGAEMHYWLGGFDEAWAPLSPSLLLLVEAVLRAPEFGCRRISLGPGVQPYKARMATGEDRLVRVDLLPRTRRYPYVRLVQAPYRLRRVVADHTPPETRQRLRQATDRLRPHREAAP